MTKSLNIGLLAPALRGFNAVDGGIANHFADLATALADDGHRVRIFVVAENPPPSQSEDPQRKYSVVAANARLPKWWDRMSFWNWQLHSLGGLFHRAGIARRTIAAAHRREPLDVVETFSTGLLGLRCLRGRNRPPLVVRVATTASQLVAHNRSDARWIERVESRLERRLAARSDQIITHTRGHREEIVRLWHLNAQQIAVVPLGIALPPRSSLPGAADRARINILFVGRFEHRKGIDTLLTAIPTVLQADSRVTFTLVGNDLHGIGKRAREAAPATFDPSRVVFANQVDDDRLQAAYRDCDIFVAPSLYESFGLIYAEAMAWGKPVIGCRAGGIPEVVADNETGLLVPPGDTAALTRALLLLAGDAALRRRLGEAGRGRSEALFSLPALARASTALYREVIAQGKRSGSRT